MKASAQHALKCIETFQFVASPSLEREEDQPFSSSLGESSSRTSRSGRVWSGQYGEDNEARGREVEDPKVGRPPSIRVPSVGAEWLDLGKLPYPARVKK